jgi:membrane protease YdiL (CAAX protease family)
MSNEEEIFIRLNGRTKEICHSDYSRISELYPFTDPVTNPPPIAEFTENFVLMATRLEAREFDLERKISELETINRELQRMGREKEESSYIFFAVVFVISIFTFGVDMLHTARPGWNMKLLHFVISRLSEATFIFFSLSFIIRFRRPFSEFGLTLRNARKSLIESGLATLGMVAILIGLKIVFVKTGWMQSDGRLFLREAADWTFIVYLVVAPLQEFIGRGVTQSAIEQVITGSSRKFIVVLLSSMIFGLTHLPYSQTFALMSVAGGVVWGILYLRHRTILGISISHYIIGLTAAMLGFFG